MVTMLSRDISLPRKRLKIGSHVRHDNIPILVKIPVKGGSDFLVGLPETWQGARLDVEFWGKFNGLQIKVKIKNDDFQKFLF